MRPNSPTRLLCAALAGVLASSALAPVGRLWKDGEVTCSLFSNEPTLWMDPGLDGGYSEVVRRHEQQHVADLAGNCWGRKLRAGIIPAERLRLEARGLCAQESWFLEQGVPAREARALTLAHLERYWLLRPFTSPQERREALEAACIR